MNLHIPSSPFPPNLIQLKSKTNQTKTRKLNPPHQNPTLPYPKSSPTPLLIPNNKTSTFLTPIQSLDRILLNLQSALAARVRVDPSTFSSLLELSFRIDPSPRRAASLHRLLPPSLLRSNPNLSSKLIRLYASSGLIQIAHNLFDKLPQSHKTSAFPYNSLISGYTNLGLYESAISIFYQMEADGVEPDRFTFPRVVKACAGIGSVSLGESVHRRIIRCGFADDDIVLNSLVDLYSKCGDIERARRIFNLIRDRGAVSWNSMINGCSRHGLFFEAIELCRGMLSAGLQPDYITVSLLIAGCCNSFEFNIGLEIHCWIIRHGCDHQASVSNSLITMYSIRGELARAWFVFESMPEKDLVSWNAVISANRRDRRVLSIYRQMQDSGVAPDSITFVSMLSACANLGLVEDGRKVFDEMSLKYGIEPGVEHYGCMVNLLGRAGMVEEAFEFVSRVMPFDGGATAWGALLYACSVHGNVSVGERAAARLFDLEPDNKHNFELLGKIYRDAGMLEDAHRVEMLARMRGL